jgi:hypothetical protein
MQATIASIVLVLFFALVVWIVWELFTAPSDDSPDGMC